MENLALSVLEIIKDVKNYMTGENCYTLKVHDYQEQTLCHHPPEIIASNDPKNIKLQSLEEKLENCYLCGLSRERIRTVFGKGNPNTGIMIIGESPGEDDDVHGEPFVGAVGELFDKMLAAIGMKRESAYICNALKCKTPHHREPKKEELLACRHYLLEQIEIVSPLVILSFGKFAAAELLGLETDFNQLRSANFSPQKNELQVNEKKIPIIVTYHPDVLILHPELKRPNWEDMKVFRDLCAQMGIGLT